MNEFPNFMKNPANAIASHQRSEGVEGYVFDGRDNSQIAIFQCARDGVSKEHVHDFDEYFVVIQGEYTLGMNGKKIRLTPGQEYTIPRETPHDGLFSAGTRTIHAFAGKRADRRSPGGDHEIMDLKNIRSEIDSTDSDIIALLSRRQELVSAAGKLKNNEQGVRDPKRVEQVIEKVRTKADLAGLDPAVAETIYRAIIGCFIQKELNEFKQRSE